jgi:hypothetical protein
MGKNNNKELVLGLIKSRHALPVEEYILDLYKYIRNSDYTND